MFYDVFRFIMGVAVRLFFRVEPPVDPHGGLAAPGPVVYVCNHPNGLVDPALVFVLSERRITFLAKAPLFRVPLLGALLRGMQALPVFRKQDSPEDMGKNEGSLLAARGALVEGRAITIFPEGKSHSEPQLAALKTGCARISLEACRSGADVQVVPIGLVYAERNRFRSRVHVEVGAPLSAKAYLVEPAGAGEGGRESGGQGEGDPHEPARSLTAAISRALAAVTLNLTHWEDLPLIELAEALYALERGGAAGSLERQKVFAKGLRLLRDEQPERWEGLRPQLASYRQRLDLLQVTPDDLNSPYPPRKVALFVLRNLLWLLALPLFLAGVALFSIPYWIPSLLTAAVKAEVDAESTYKLMVSMLLAPLWWGLLGAAAFWFLGPASGIATLLLVPPLALFTRLFYERRSAAAHDVRVFLMFWRRKSLKERLLAEGRALAGTVVALADALERRTG